MSEVCVQVAVRIRPLLAKEVLHNHRECVRSVPDSADVVLGLDRVFSFDHAFGPAASQNEVYESCVQPLVKALVCGYNATVFCYGQTGSGKTYTLGGGNLNEDGGVIDCVARDVFLLLGEKGKNGNGMEASVRVSYMELYMEELRDLLELPTIHKELHIREDEKGNTVVVGAKEMVVTSAEELLRVVEVGNALRRTGITGMNERSSRSHAILMLQLTQSCHKNSLKSIRSSKLCLVDLAGLERAGKTGNTGTRFKESVHINTGLLALGNVIRALSDPGRHRYRNRCSSAYIPYRDAKITRLLRDSLGGNSHTLMMACVSPSDRNMAETLTVLQFASKARHIRNHPTDASTHSDKSCPTTWNCGEAPCGELEHQVQTQRELLKEKGREVAMARGGFEEGHNLKQPSQMVADPNKKRNPGEPSQYWLLAQEASALFADLSGSTLSHSFRQQLQDWQERLTSVNHSHPHDDGDRSEGGDQHDWMTILNLREELNKVKKALTLKEQLLEQKDAELRRIQYDLETILQENKADLQALQEEKQRNRVQTQQLLDQEILISRLRNSPLTIWDVTSGATVEAEASENTGKRPHSDPLILTGCGQESTRRFHSCPPAYSMERVMAALKVRSKLLLAEVDEKDAVYCPFIKQQTDFTDMDQEQEEEEEEEGIEIGSRHPLKITWTSWQNQERNSGQDQTFNGSVSTQQPQRATGTQENHAEQRQMKNARARARATQRIMQDLSVNIGMKEALIKELNQTDKETQTMVRCGREAGVLQRLSVQSQQVQAEVYRSLQHMRMQREQLQANLKQQRKTTDDIKQLYQTGEQKAKDVIVSQSKLQEHSKEKQHAGNWLEEEEEHGLRRRAELRELEEELKRREEVLQRKQACLQQKTGLEVKMLCTSQALTRDLLRSSMQLNSLEEQLQRHSRGRQTEGAAIKELEKERDKLKRQRDTLDAQLKDNKLLTVEEENLLLWLEEAMEGLDEALEFKNRSIQDKKQKLLLSDSSSCQSQSSESTQYCDVIRKLKKLSAPEASKLLVKYLNKVICLREVEHHLQLRCEELELQVGEKDVMLRELEIAMQHLTLDADRRITQLHRDHQSNIQQLLKKLNEGGLEEAEQAFKDRLQHLEKELFFYKCSSRSLKKKFKECLSDTLHPVNQPPHSQKNIQIHTEVPRNTKIHTQAPKERVADPAGTAFEMMLPVRLCRSQLREIPPPDLQVCDYPTRRRQSLLDTSTETILEDSIEAPRRVDD